uniref:Secreted protein n=1 Tax=Rhabditophanes sp. KR3021 TaxID=114890 RepID=A0AC35UEH6_9BILA
MRFFYSSMIAVGFLTSTMFCQAVDEQEARLRREASKKEALHSDKAKLQSKNGKKDGLEYKSKKELASENQMTLNKISEHPLIAAIIHSNIPNHIFSTNSATNQRIFNERQTETLLANKYDFRNVQSRHQMIV